MRRLLLIDDDPDWRRLVKLSLEGSENRSALAIVVEAPTAEAGLVALEGGGFDAVLLDFGLPTLQGMAALRAVVGVARGAPVIVITGREQAALEYGAEAAHNGAAALVEKPDTVKPERLGARLAALVEEAIARQAWCSRQPLADVAARLAEIVSIREELAGLRQAQERAANPLATLVAAWREADPELRKRVLSRVVAVLSGLGTIVTGMGIALAEAARRYLEQAGGSPP